MFLGKEEASDKSGVKEPASLFAKLLKDAMSFSAFSLKVCVEVWKEVAKNPEEEEGKSAGTSLHCEVVSKLVQPFTE